MTAYKTKDLITGDTLIFAVTFAVTRGDLQAGSTKAALPKESGSEKILHPPRHRGQAKNLKPPKKPTSAPQRPTTIRIARYDRPVSSSASSESPAPVAGDLSDYPAYPARLERQ